MLRDSTFLDNEVYINLINLGVLAWNISLFSGDKRQEMFSDFFKNFAKKKDSEFNQEIRNFIEELIERKEKLFPHDQRFIRDYNVEERGDELFLSIASSLPPKNDDEG